MEYDNTRMQGQNDVMREELFGIPCTSISGKAYKLTETSKYMPFTEDGVAVAECIMSRWTSGPMKYSNVMIAMLTDAYNCGIIAGKREERNKKSVLRGK